MKPAHILLIALATTLAACGSGEPASSEVSDPQLLEAVREGAKPAAAKDCLLLLWSAQASPDIDFDRANDVARGGAISCATDTTPSEFRAAIDTLRAAAQNRDKARLLEAIGFPLLYIDESGQRRELGEDEIGSMFDEVFDPTVLDALQRLDLSQITVENEQGAYFELGSLWLVVDRQGGRPRLVTVNRQALLEAAQAAKNRTERGLGRPL